MEKIKSLKFFERFSEDELVVLKNFLKERDYSEGERIIEEGEVGDELFIFVEGRARITRRVVLPLGYGKSVRAEKSFAVVSPEEVGFFGEMSLITGLPRSATVEAISPCRFLVMDRASFELLQKEHPEVALKLVLRLAEGLCHRVEALNQKVLKLTTVLSIIARIK